MNAPQPPVSLTQHVASLDVGEHVICACWLKGEPAFALAGGAVRLGEGAGQKLIDIHGEAGLLVAASVKDRLLTGGGDGRVCLLDARGGLTELGHDSKGGWITALAASASGAAAWSVGKQVTVRSDKGALKTFTAPSSATGLAFAPKGHRLAIAHYNGATLWFPNLEVDPIALEWKGSHLGVIWSPDGRFVVTSMQENALHGWRLPESPTGKTAHMRMSGYPAKTRSLVWSHDGQWLATSGADAVIIWPFQGDGPMGKAPRECGVRRARVSQVAFHPAAYVIAAGYEDGCILLIRMTDASELLVRPAVRDSAITAFAWHGDGKRLAFGTSDGQAGILTLPA